jgi:hypothetical protein
LALHFHTRKLTNYFLKSKAENNFGHNVVKEILQLA